MYRNVWVLIYPTQSCTLCSTVHAKYSYVQECLGPDIPNTVITLCSTVHAKYSYVQECLGPDIPYTVMYSLPYSTKISELESNQRLHKQVITKIKFYPLKESVNISDSPGKYGNAPFTTWYP